MEFIDNYIWIEFSFTSCYWTKDRLATRNSTSSSAIIKFKKSKMERSYCQIQSVPPRRRIFRYVVSTFNLSSSASRNFTSKSVPSDIWKLSLYFTKKSEETFSSINYLTLWSIFNTCFQNFNLKNIIFKKFNRWWFKIYLFKVLQS